MNDDERFADSPRPAGPGRSTLPSGVLKVLCGVLGALFTLGALVLAADPINAAAYYLGYGDELRVEVTESSVGSMPSKDSEAGEGRVVGDGRVVHLYGVTEGEIVTARPVLLDVSLAYDNVYHEGATVSWGFTSLIGVFLIGGFGLVFLLGFVAIPWRAKKQPKDPGTS